MKSKILIAIALIGCASSHASEAVPGDAGSLDASLFPDAAPPCANTCSDDLTGVVDCHGNVVSTCGAGLACNADLGCSEPCSASESLESSRGCHYAVPPPAVYSESNGSCFAVLVANAWNEPVSLNVAWGARTFDTTTIARVASGGTNVTLDPFPSNGMLPPGKLAVVFLADRAATHGNGVIGCPNGVQAAVTDVDSELTESAVGQAFTITSSAPVVAYDMFPYGGAPSYLSSASLLLPTSTWSTQYAAVHAFQNDDTLPGGASPYLQIVASADAHVTLWPTSSIAADDAGVQGGAQNQPYHVTLAAGEFLQLVGQDLTGTPITSDVPIAVVGGNTCMRIPIGVVACDSGHQQLLPVSSLGSVYVGARYRDRVAGAHEIVPYRILGVAADTALTYDPPIAGAPATIGAGELATFWTSTDFVVRSQDTNHPFYVSAHMTGGANLAGADGGASAAGDPDFVNVVTPAQYQRSYTFLTDPTYANTHLVFVRQRNASNAFDDVKLACAGTLSGWTAVDAADQFEVARVDLVKDGAGVGACGNGVQTASSASPFAITVWGWDAWVSYAYPAGTFIQRTNQLDITPN
ncbi:MAG TPA: IgGFc-binding protein [Polyangiaceae bacterium]|jgi:hypothetical protein|nr:IgGFc-binding protein [Polyangiaceae bacterium]